MAHVLRFCGCTLNPTANSSTTSHPINHIRTDDDRSSHPSTARLLEHLPIRPLVRLTLHLNRLVPAPLVLEEFLVLRLGRVELGELVALVVGGDVEGGEGVVAAHEEGTADDGVVAAAVD